MSDSSDVTLPTGRHGQLIEAAWRQVEGLPRSGDLTIRGSPSRLFQPIRIAPDAFPGYRVIEEIHRGGQGVVVKALQESTKRDVAIKVLRDGHLLTPADVARFELEVHILGRLRHPNVVRIYDSHVADGRLYYVMDYIPGQTLDTYVRSAGLAPDAIVRLFVKICDAVNAAHLHGIIHRDLKPGNIRIDPGGEPYVLDFGLSKLADGGSSEFTLTGQFVGSVPWASPEQAAGNIDVIDLRTDVYSLGVLLYQMLTGRFPYAVQGSPTEALRRILESEPTPPRRHVPNLPTDLETIVLKCLQKEPQRRYQSAGELARDLERCLAGEPIEARRDSFSYMLGKQLVRYRFAALGASGFVLLLAAGLAVSLALWRQADAARQRAESERTYANEQEALARDAAERATRESAKTHAVADFLSQMIASANPFEGGSADVRVIDTLDAARRRLEQSAFAGEPAVEAAVRRVLGMAYGGLGSYEAAHDELRRALELFTSAAGPDDPETIETLLKLAAMRRAMGRSAEAEADLRTVLERGGRVLDPGSAILAAATNELGGVLEDRGELEAAEPLFRRALEMRVALRGEQHEEVARSANDLAIVLQARGQYDEAQSLFERALRITAATVGDNHPSYATHLANLASLRVARGDYDKAEELYQQAIERMRNALGARHPSFAKMLSNYANLCRQRQRYPQAEKLFLEALDVYRATLGDRHPSVGYTLHNLAITQYSLGRFDDAASSLDGAIDVLRNAEGADADALLSSQMVLAAIQRARGDLPAAEAILRDMCEAHVKRRGPDDVKTLSARGNLAMVLFDEGRLDDAEPIFEDVLARRRAVLGDAHPETISALQQVADCRHKRGKLAEAEAMMREALEFYLLNKQGQSAALAYNQLGMIASDDGRDADAEALAREAIAAATAALPPQHPELALMRSNRAAYLDALGRTDEAIQELLTAHDAFVATLGRDHAHARRTRRNLAQLYDKLGNAEDAAKWRDAPAASAPSETPEAP